MELICPFCNKRVEGELPRDCTRCEAQDGPGTGTPMQKYKGFNMRLMAEKYADPDEREECMRLMDLAYSTGVGLDRPRDA
jgi:hypothetical protein